MKDALMVVMIGQAEIDMVDAITSKTVTSAKPPGAGSSTFAPKNNKTLAATEPSLNPRLVYDRLAGVVVTQFFNESGAVQLQTPSNAVLAYLKVGLGTDGYSKPEAEAPTRDTTFDS